MVHVRKSRAHWLYVVFGLLLSSCVLALEIEPRQWSHLPVGVNFAGLGYAYTEADIGFDPVLQLENVQMEKHTWAGKYVRTFELLKTSARIDVAQGYQKAKWHGLLEGLPAETEREGLSDTFVRFSVNLYGAPPLAGQDYRSYRSGKSIDTVVGLGLAVRLPTGDYLEEKLLNLGGNRFVFRPQLGFSHRRGKWSAELTAETAFYTENDEFFGGNRLEQDPLFMAYGHLTYTFRPGLWLSASAGADYGGETTINGVDKNDRKHNIGWKLSAAYPINSRLGLKLSYLVLETQESTGADSNSLLASLTYMW